MRRPGFTLEQIRSFVAVADVEHISQAATSLFLTQAAVSQQVRHFEHAVGLQLLERDGRRVRLTDAGRSMADACKAALRALEVVEDSATAIRDLAAGSLQFGASPTAAAYYVPPILAQFTRHHPHVKLSIAIEPSAELNRRVLVGSLDCAVIEGRPDPALFVVGTAQDELLLVAHRDHPLAQLSQITPEDFTRHLYLGRGPQWSAERYVREMLGDAYDKVEALNLGHPEYVRSAVLAGLGFVALSKRAIAVDLVAGTVTRLPVPSVLRPISAVRRSAKGGPTLEAFWDLLTGGTPVVSTKIALDGH